MANRFHSPTHPAFKSAQATSRKPKAASAKSGGADPGIARQARRNRLSKPASNDTRKNIVWGS